MRNTQPPETPTHEEVFFHVLQRVKTFVFKNVIHIALVIAVATAAVLSYKTHVLKREGQRLQNWETLGGLPATALLYRYPPEQAEQLSRDAIEKCRQIISSGRSLAAPWAQLRLGQLLAFRQEWPAAIDTLKALLAEYPDSPAAALSGPALGAMFEESGRYDEAALLYEQLAQTAATHHLLAAGRCRELAGDAEAAKALYSRFLESSPQEPEWRDMAEARLLAVKAGKLLGSPPKLQPHIPVAAERLLPTPATEPETPVATQPAGPTAEHTPGADPPGQVVSVTDSPLATQP